MTIKQFIEKAVAGGCIKSPYPFHLKEVLQNGTAVIQFQMPTRNGSFPSDSFYTIEQLVLNPHVWQAVGKTEGWDGKTKTHTYTRYIHSGKPKLGKITVTRKNKGSSLNWKVKMHRLIDALAEGKTIEQFLETL